MLNNAIRRRLAYLLMGCVLAVFATRASAQIVAGGQQPNIPQQNGGPLMFPGMNGMMPGASQLSPQQLQSIMMMRALQMRGRHQVRTGFPQDIPLGTAGSLGGPAATPAAEETTASRKSSASKKADARAAREEKKRAAREEAKAKKAKASKKAKADDEAAASR